MADTRTKHRQINQKVEKTEDPKLLLEILTNVNSACESEMRAYVREGNNQQANILSRMWVQGRRIENLKRPEYQKAKDGGKPINPVALLAKYEGVSESYLDKKARLYRVFKTEEERDKLLSLRMKNSGKPLTWAHMEQLLKFYPADGKSTEAYDNMLKRTLEEDLAPADIDQHLKSSRRVNGEQEARGGGRPVSVPPTLHGRLSKAIKQTDALMRAFEEIYDNDEYNFIQSVKDMDQEAVAQSSNELVTTIGKLRDNMEELVQAMQAKVRHEIPEVFEYIRECVAAKSKSEDKGKQAAEKPSKAKQKPEE
jgi:hypothetical protein